MNHEAGSHTFSGLRGPAISVPLGFDSLAPQHTTPNVGGDTLRDKKIVSEYNQEIPQSQIADNPVAS